MKFLKLPFKILAAPFILVLAIATPVFTFLFCYAVAILQVVSGLGVLVSIALFITKEFVGGGVFLLLAFLLSPLGIPAIAERLIVGMGSIRYSLQDFIMS